MTEPEIETNPIKPFLDRLEPREILSVVLRHGLNGKEPQTLESISHKIGTTRERVRQILTKSYRKLRNKEYLAELAELKGQDFKRFDFIEPPKVPKAKRRISRYRTSVPGPLPIPRIDIPSSVKEDRQPHWSSIIFNRSIVAPINKYGALWQDACTHLGHYSYYRDGITKQLLVPRNKVDQILSAMKRIGYRHMEIGSFYHLGREKIIAIGEHTYGNVPKTWINCIQVPQHFRS